MKKRQLPNSIEDINCNIFTVEQLKKILEPTPEEFLESYMTLGNDELCGVWWPYYQWKIDNVVGMGNWECHANLKDARFDKNADNIACCAIPVTVQILKHVNAVEGEDFGVSSVERNVIWSTTVIGNAIARNASSAGDLAKAATTDAIKKAFSQLGFFRDVYTGQAILPKKKKASPISGTSDFSDEEKKKIRLIWRNMTDALRNIKEKIGTKKTDGKELKKEEKRLASMTPGKLMKLLTAVLLKIGEEDSQITIKEGEELKTAADIHTMYEWDKLQNWFTDYIFKVSGDM